ncbi:MAG: 30S ribosomal protein S8 [Alphaproteobacteria bacterium]|nr:MAG: 30S ribosomal protein S8 [Alphaproteobacteria bacterium]
MNINDPIGDLITRIRNGYMRRHDFVLAPVSRMRTSILTVLKENGYISDFSQKKVGKFDQLQIKLRYTHGVPGIEEIVRVSKPGRRVYTSVADLPRVYNGLGVSVLSTPKGVLADSTARAQSVGGEYLFKVF